MQLTNRSFNYSLIILLTAILTLASGYRQLFSQEKEDTSGLFRDPQALKAIPQQSLMRNKLSRTTKPLSYQYGITPIITILIIRYLQKIQRFLTAADFYSQRTDLSEQISMLLTGLTASWLKQATVHFPTRRYLY